MCDVGNCTKLVLCDYLEGWAEAGGGSLGGGHMYACGPFMLICGRNHHSVVNYPPVIKSSVKAWW